MSHEAPLGIALLLLFVVVIYLRKALGMRKLSRVCSARAEGAIIWHR